MLDKFFDGKKDTSTLEILKQIERKHTMNAFDSMFDMDGDGSLDIAERALQMEFLDRAAAGDGDVDWDKDPYEDDFDDDGFDEDDDW